MAFSFDYSRRLYDRSLGSLPLLPHTPGPPSDALLDARLHRPKHCAHFSDVAAAVRMPCSKLAAATACRRLSLMTSEIAFVCVCERAGRAMQRFGANVSCKADSR